MIETRYYKFTGAKKYLTSGIIHNCHKTQRYNPIFHMYAQLAVWYMDSSKELTTNQSKNHQDEIYVVPQESRIIVTPLNL